MCEVEIINVDTVERNAVVAVAVRSRSRPPFRVPQCARRSVHRTRLKKGRAETGNWVTPAAKCLAFERQ